MAYEIPTEGTIPFLDITVPIHWENHAVLMFLIWFVLVPGLVVFLRFGKVPVTIWGMSRGAPKLGREELPWTLHKWGLYTAILLSLAGAGVALVLSGGFSGTLHAWFGTATVVLGVLQGVTAWNRGSHGGQRGAESDPDDRSTWGGDHFDMTPQRWWFEAWHKTSGYFALFCAGGAVATGLNQFWMPSIAIAFGLIVLTGLVGAVVLQGLGFNRDTYSSVYGSHAEHPYNKRRYKEMIDARDEKP